MKRTALTMVIVLTTLLAALDMPVRAETSGSLMSLEFTHAPAGDDGQVVVLLGDDGYWQEVQNEQVRWRMRIDASWNDLYKPETVFHSIQLRPAGYPHVYNVLTCRDLPTCSQTNWQQAAQEEPFHANFVAPYTAAFTDDTLFADPVTQCNTRRAHLLNQGSQLRHILSNDQAIPQHAMSWLGVWGTGTEVYKELQVPLTVVCKGNVQIAEALDPHPVPNSQNVALSFQVTDAFLSILPGHKTTTSCPAELSFIGKIHTAGNGPATVEYRFEWPTGEKSTPFSVRVEDASEGADIFHKVAVPLGPAFAAGAGVPGGGKSAAVGGGFVPNPQSPSSGQASGGVQPQGGTFTSDSLPGNEHKGDVRLVVLSHNNVESPPAGYHIVCEPKVSAGVAGAGGLTAPARQPVQGDPDRPVVTGTPPNRAAARRPGERVSGGQGPSTSQPQQSDTEFLQAPASRASEARTPSQSPLKTRTPASRAPASTTPDTRFPAPGAPEPRPASRQPVDGTSTGRTATGNEDPRRVKSARPAGDDDSRRDDES